jgi:hypothetical protein
MDGILSLKQIIESTEQPRHPLDADLALFLIKQFAIGLQKGGGASWPTPDEETSDQ